MPAKKIVKKAAPATARPVILSPAAPLVKAAKAITHTEVELVKELKSLAKEVQNLRDLELMQIFKNPFKFMWFSFLKGLMVGLGSVLGATVLVAILVYILSQFSSLPFLGDLIENFTTKIDQQEQTNR